MKTLSVLCLVAFTLISFSCKKELAKLEGKTCWKCHVYGSPNPAVSDYDKTVCTDGDTPPTFHDDYGNDMNSNCTKQ